jgi:hypothetical protein
MFRQGVSGTIPNWLIDTPPWIPLKLAGAGKKAYSYGSRSVGGCQVPPNAFAAFASFGASRISWVDSGEALACAGPVKE